MANEVIQIGNKIELRAISRRSTVDPAEEPEVYISQFLQWSDRNVAVIAMPFYQNHLVPLRVEDTFELRFFTKGGLYRCRATVIKRSKASNNIAVAEVKFISALEKYQRRQFYRMNCIIPLSYCVLTEYQRELYREKKNCISQEQLSIVEKKLEQENMELLKGTILDISGGGIRFNSPAQQNTGDILLLRPALPETLRKKIPFLFGRIISSKRIPNKEPATYDNRVEFVEISHGEQEQIITYIFKEERDKRKRESDLK